MGISLKSIELTNVRSHRNFKFEPADSGITALSGPTGSGKSTIVDALAWTLFGHRNKGLKHSDFIREGIDFKKDEKPSSTVVFEIDGVLIKVERRITAKGGAQECEVWEWDSEGKEWKHKAGTATSHAENYIRQVLKMDKDGFTTAVLVQQKQVDHLISSGPTDRAKVIEKLTGIASISSAIVAARQERNKLKDKLDDASVDEDELSRIDGELLESSKRLTVLKDEHRIAKDKLQAVHGKLKEFEGDVDEKVKLFERSEKARKAQSEIEVRLETAEGLLLDAKREKDEAKAQLPSGGSRGVSFDDSLRALKRLQSAVATLESSKLYHERILSNSSAKLRELKGIIADSDFESLEDLEKAEESSQEELESIGKKLRKLSDEAGELRGEISQFESAIEVVSHGEDCPTCRQSVADVSGAVKALEGQRDAIQARLKKLEAKGEKLQAERELKRRLSRTLDELTESFEELAREEKAVTESESELADVSSDLKARSSELKAADKLHRIVEREEENSRRYEAALARLQKIMQTIDDLKAKNKRAAEILKETKAPSEQKINGLRKKLYEQQVSYQDGRVALGDLKAEARILSGSIGHLTEKKEAAEKEIERHQDLLKSVEVATATLQTLIEFRTDRVKTALPTIESYASELLSRFTDGKFVALNLDEKFNASVVLSSGAKRPVALLSGGELSAAAIALRLSVSMMLNASDSSNLIILDEVLVSQDADRSELILSTIKDVCRGQVVMISHGSGVSAVADKKVDLAGS